MYCHIPRLQQSYFNTGDEFFGNATCEEGTFSLYANYTYSYDNVSYISGIPLVCVDGGRYATICNDGTSDPQSAILLCSGLGYYGWLLYISHLNILDFNDGFLFTVICIGGGMFTNTNYSVSDVPEGTFYSSNVSCDDAFYLDACDGTGTPYCPYGPIGLMCYQTGIHFAFFSTQGLTSQYTC